MNSFEQAVRDSMRDIEGEFSYESMVQNHLNEDKYRPWVELINGYKPVEGADVFSSGCGSANDFSAYFDMGAHRVSGVEVDHRLVDLAEKRKQSRAWGDRADVQFYDGRIIPYEDESFDIITSLHVIEHVADMPLYVNELVRVLRPDGVVFMDFPNRFYVIEQHTGLKVLHTLPHPLAQALIKGLLKVGSRMSVIDKNRSKLTALIDYRPPFAGAVLRQFSKAMPGGQRQVEKACYHNYGDMEVPMGGLVKPWLQIYRGMSAIRLVIRKI